MEWTATIEKVINICTWFRPSYAVALWNTFKGYLVKIAIVKLLHDSIVFVGPMALNLIIDYLSSPSENTVNILIKN